MGRKIGKILIVLGMIFLLNVLGSRAEEKVQMYQIYCEEPNGEKGYYTKSVKVEIEHYKVSVEFPGWERVDWGIGESERKNRAGGEFI